METNTIPAQFNNIIWAQQYDTAKQGDYILAEPVNNGQVTDPDYDTDTVAMKLSIVSVIHDDGTSTPILFSNQIEAELYKDFMLELDETHPVKTYSPTPVSPRAQITGCRLKQHMAVCPKCKKYTQYGDPKSGEFFCPYCRKQFNPTKT